MKKVVQTMKAKHIEFGYNFLSPDTISKETKISVERVKRILNRGIRDGIIRRNRGQKDVYALTNVNQ